MNLNSRISCGALLLSLVMNTAAMTRCQADPRKPAAPSVDSTSDSKSHIPVRPTAAATVGKKAGPGKGNLPGPSLSDEEQRKTLLQAAKTAWVFVQRNYSTSTGLAPAHETYRFVTVWDIASALAAYHAAYGLNFIDRTEYRRRVDRALETLSSMALYNGAAYNKLYASDRANMVDRKEQPSSLGYGWSALDIGRFLVWMKILEQNDSTAAPVIQRIVKRINLNDIVKDGYLRGSDLNLRTNKPQEYQEGRIGYEQYAAEGYALWGARAEKALSFSENAKPIDIYGQRILADRRGDDLLTSEPFVMMGMELGWTNPTWEEQARSVLAAQRERFNKTGILTMLSEDAVPEPPAYFYYYLLTRNGEPFVVTSPSGQRAKTFPRWVSTKAAFGWHALFPSDYTWSAVRAVLPAGATNNGWTAGVYESSARPTKSFNLNTAAIVLEAAYYAQRGCPLIRPRCN